MPLTKGLVLEYIKNSDNLLNKTSPNPQRKCTKYFGGHFATADVMKTCEMMLNLSSL